MKFKPTGLYAITNESADLEQKTAKILKAGVCLLQYRHKMADFDFKIAQARHIQAQCQQYKTPFIINDDIDLAIEISADGVHLGKDDADLSQARQRLGDQAIIGISCYDQLELALEGEKNGADYIAFGRFFPSSTKPNAPQAPLLLLQQAQRQINIPIVAIGGINLDNAPQLIKQGAGLLAVIDSLFNTPDLTARTQQFRTLFEENIND